jgi:hypothetical protein
MKTPFIVSNVRVAFRHPSKYRPGYSYTLNLDPAQLVFVKKKKDFYLSER